LNKLVICRILFITFQKLIIMKPILFYSAWTCIALAMTAILPAHAQESRIYRCANNEYTNQIRGRTDCKPVEGGNVTVVSGGTTAAPPRTSSGGGSGAPAMPQRVDSPDQRARDSDAKTILESELRKTQARQTELQKVYNNGVPDKQGDEARNYQKYLDRVAGMKAELDRTEADIEGIKRELNRFNR
jgi:hypothetical protein